jgi:hypothetical protein
MLIVGLMAVLLQAEAAQAALVYPPDASLTIVEYVQHGVPDPERHWSPSDYTAAVNVLRQLRDKDAALLPRLGSPRSGALFSRLVSRDNLGVLRVETLPRDGRLGLVADFLGSLKQVTLLYLEPSVSKIAFDDELAEAQGFGLAIHEELVRLWVESGRQDGTDRLRGNVANYLASVMDAMSERTFWRVGARRRLVSHLNDSLRVLAPFESEVQRVDVRNHLKRVADTEPDGEVRALVMQAQAVLEAK